MQRRLVAAVAVGAALSAVALPAYAGSYLDRAGVLTGLGSRESDFLRARLGDGELALALHRVARGRLDAAARMQVPKEVAQAHPHVLLVLENYERAANAAAEGSPERFLVYQRRAREEEQVLRGVLKQLGWALPKL
ncbi:MAG: hypothetical protein IT376_19935 [Polyangiaceae bacterium]|nr:hypothetical protein [Polyangiaceae bacterium]